MCPITSKFLVRVAQTDSICKELVVTKMAKKTLNLYEMHLAQNLASCAGWSFIAKGWRLSSV
jgi:hypothetical protein